MSIKLDSSEIEEINSLESENYMKEFGEIMAPAFDNTEIDFKDRPTGTVLPALQRKLDTGETASQPSNSPENIGSEQDPKEVILTSQKTAITPAIRCRPNTAFDRKHRFKSFVPASAIPSKIVDQGREIAETRSDYLVRSSSYKLSQVPQCSQGSQSQLSQALPSLLQYQLPTDKYRPSFTPGPSRIRIVLRDLLMFLLIANSSFWMLTSLDGTAFKSYPYQELYFGTRVWKIITSATAPFCMFLKLYSAVCLFKIWSFA